MKKDKEKVKALELLENPRLLDIIKQELSKKIVGEDDAKITIFFGLITAYSDYEPMNLIISGGSSVGKSYLMENILKLFPEGTYKLFRRVTASALDRYRSNDPEFSWNHKILAIGELGALPEDSHTVRQLLSDGGGTLLSTEEKRKVKELKVSGRPVFVTSTAEEEVETQFFNRALIITLDQSEDQTKKILKYIAEICENPENIIEFNPIITTAISELKNFDVIIPYSRILADKFPTKRLRARRDFSSLIKLVKASAILHQKQRKKKKHKEKTYLVADLTDYENARNLAHTVLDTTRMDITGILKESYEILKRHYLVFNAIGHLVERKEFTIDDVVQKKLFQVSPSNVYVRLNNLVGKGLLVVSKRRDVVSFDGKYEREIGRPKSYYMISVVNTENPYPTRKELEEKEASK